MDCNFAHNFSVLFCLGRRNIYVFSVHEFCKLDLVSKACLAPTHRYRPQHPTLYSIHAMMITSGLYWTKNYPCVLATVCIHVHRLWPLSGVPESQYRSVPSKCPWALGIHSPNIKGGRLHGEATCMYTLYTRTAVGSSKSGGGVLIRK